MFEIDETSSKQQMTEISRLIKVFAHKDGVERRKARIAIEEIGKPAVPALIQALSDKKPEVRWESARALGAIQDDRSAPALVQALMDVSFEIRWLAAEALIALEEKAIDPLMKALEQQSDSIDLQQGAHHVLHALERNHKLDEPTLAVLEAIRSMDPEVTVPGAAYEALKSREKK
jgi:HEAT repeat protein